MYAIRSYYVNVAGCDPYAEVGEFHRPETHLIPLMLDAIDGRRPALTVFGSDYPTADGTCIRDYVHVSDLVDVHVLGLKCVITSYSIHYTKLYESWRTPGCSPSSA